MRISAESWVLFGICSLDAWFTAWLLTTGQAAEANPILRFYLDAGGVWGFLAAKFLLTAGPLLALEVIRMHRPHFVRGLLRCGIAFYLVTYGVGVWRVNAGGGFDHSVR